MIYAHSGLASVRVYDQHEFGPNPVTTRRVYVTVRWGSLNTLYISLIQELR